MAASFPRRLKIRDHRAVAHLLLGSFVRIATRKANTIHPGHQPQLNQEAQ